MSVQFKRRIRARKKSSVPKVSLEDRAKELAVLEHRQAQINAQVAMARDKLRKAFIKSGTRETTVSFTPKDSEDAYYGVFVFQSSAGRSTTVVDPEQYWQRVSQEDFFSSISVKVTEARKCMGEKELQSISTVIPGEVKPAEVKTKYLAINNTPITGKGKLKKRG